METVEVALQNNISIITYDNKPRGFLTAKGSAKLLDAVRDALVDAEVRVLIITGVEDVFIRHYDVSEILKISRALSSGKIDAADLDEAPIEQLARLLENSPKPVIAAINGICMGGGFELAMMCDIRVASRSADAIGLPETRLNIIPGGGGTQRLPRLIGEAAALNFILRGRAVNAEEAAEIGLISEIANDALERAIQIGAELTKRNAASLGAVKHLVKGSCSKPIVEGLEEEKRVFLDVIREEGAVLKMQEFCDSAEKNILS